MPSKRTPTRSQPASAADRLIETLERQVSDFRLLLDQAAEREKRLLAMVDRLMHAVRREPVIISRPPSEVPGRIAPAVPVEALADSPEFDEKGDAQHSAAEQKAFEDAQQEFAALLSEENEYRARRGEPAVKLEVQTA